MTLKLNENSSPEEIAAFEQAVLGMGRSDLARMAYGVRMIRDANALKNPLPKADRYDLAINAFAQSVEEARRVARATGDSQPVEYASGIYQNFLPQYLANSVACLESYHQGRLETLRKSKSGKRQLASTRVAIRELSRFEGRYRMDPLRATFDRLWAYWRDQEMLLAAYDEGE